MKLIEIDEFTALKSKYVLVITRGTNYVNITIDNNKVVSFIKDLKLEMDHIVTLYGVELSLDITLDVNNENKELLTYIKIKSSNPKLEKILMSLLMNYVYYTLDDIEFSVLLTLSVPDILRDNNHNVLKNGYLKRIGNLSDVFDIIKKLFKYNVIDDESISHELIYLRKIEQ